MSATIHYKFKLRKPMTLMGVTFNAGHTFIYEGQNADGFKCTHGHSCVSYVPFEDADLIRTTVVCIDHEEIIHPAVLATY